MKTIIKIYYTILIIFRIPSCFIHELLHFIPAFIFDGCPKINMNIDFNKLTFSPTVDYIKTGSRVKEIIIISSPIWGIIIPVILSIFTLNILLISISIYQLINIKCSFLSQVDIKSIKPHLIKKSFILN